MPFDPNRPYQTEDDISEFDPSKPYETEDDEAVSPPMDVSRPLEPAVKKSESLARGYAQGLTSDFADEIAARVLGMMEGRPYEEILKEQRQKFTAAQQANPMTYGAGQFAGGATQGAALTAIPGGIPARLAASTALGGLQAYGASEKDLAGSEEDIRSGMGTGLGFGLFGEAMPVLAQGARSFATNRAAAALGAERGTIKSIGPEKVRQAGRVALEEGTFGPFTQTTGMQTRNEAMLKRAAESMNDVFNQIDSTGRSYFSPWEAAINFERKAGGFDRRLPVNAAKVRQYERNLDSILRKGGESGENISFADAMSLKSDLNDLANWKSKDKITVQEEMARDAYFAVSEAIDSAVEKASQELGRTDLGQQLTKAKRLYSAGKTAEKLLENRYAREQGNKMGTGLTNTIAGTSFAGLSMYTQDPKYLLPIAGKMIYEKVGQQSMARSANAIANILEASPEALGRYAPALKEAAMKGGQSLAVQHYVRSQNDPQYAELVRQAVEEEEKKKIDLPRSKPIGEQFGELIDTALWSDKIGLDPGETGSGGFEYGEGVPQPASIKPFSFKKLWPSKSSVGSEVKQLPPVKRHGVTRDTSRQFTPEELLKGDDFYAYRDLTIPKPFESNKFNTLRFKEGQTTLSEDVFGRKIDLRNKKSNYYDEKTRENPSFLSGEGAMYHNPTRTGVSGAFSRSPQATKHEHIHTQIERLNEIHPEAGAAMDWYLRKKAKEEYKVPIAWITDSMHGPAEFMPLVGDMLEDVRMRKRYFNYALEKDHPYGFFMPRLRKFYNEAADQVSKMDKHDILNIVQDYIEAGKKRSP